MRRTVYTADHEDFRQAVKGFVGKWVEPRLEDFAAKRLIDREVWEEAGSAGLLGLSVPEEFGGGEADDFRYQCVFNEELSAVSAALASSFSIHTDIVAPYLVEMTTQEQKERWLPGFCAGTKVAAIGMTEPSGGSDLAALKTTARLDGDSFVLNGSKTFITNGYAADLVIVAARTGTTESRAKGISLIVVEAGTPGFERGRKLDKVGQHEADTAELFFNDCRVPATNLIGDLDRGFQAMMVNLAQERLSCAVSNLAHARGVLTDTIAYVKERKAFGKTIADFQATRFTLAEQVTTLDVAQAWIDACLTAHVNGELSAVDAAKAKYWSSDVQNSIIDACVQLYGGYGYMREYRVAQAWMDARVSRIWAGSNEIMKELISRDIVGQPRPNAMPM